MKREKEEKFRFCWDVTLWKPRVNALKTAFKEQNKH